MIPFIRVDDRSCHRCSSLSRCLRKDSAPRGRTVEPDAARRRCGAAARRAPRARRYGRWGHACRAMIPFQGTGLYGPRDVSGLFVLRPLRAQFTTTAATRSGRSCGKLVIPPLQGQDRDRRCERLQPLRRVRDSLSRQLRRVAHIHANAIEALLTGRSMAPMSPAVSLLGTLAVALVVGLAGAVAESVAARPVWRPCSVSRLSW